MAGAALRWVSLLKVMDESGVIVDPDGYVVTNAHVIETSEVIGVALSVKHPIG